MELLPLLLLFGMLGLMMYFMSRRQRRAMQQQQELQSSLNVGDRIMTTSGLQGTITDVSADTTIDIEIAPGVETTWLRAAVREKIVEQDDVEEYVDDDEVLDEDEMIEESDVSSESDVDAKPSKQQS
jgi:preprotein translocase subunit YajC